MGIFHQVYIIISFNFIILNYCIFCFSILFIKVWQWAIDKYALKPSHYISGIISIVVIIMPMMASLILTILYRDTPYFLFDWLIYAYALFGTIKMTLAIKNMFKKNKTEKEYVLCIFGIISASYTIQMMEFALIKTFSVTQNETMFILQLMTQGAIFILAIVLMICLFYKSINKIKNNNKK